MNRLSQRAALGVALLTAGATAPAVALDNPLVVDVHTKNAAAKAASATIFQTGDTVLVNVTVNGDGIPKHAAVTLNDGSCTKPGGVAFALSPFTDRQSLTTLRHTLSDVADKAKSMVVHENGSETSPVAACGDLKS